MYFKIDTIIYSDTHTASINTSSIFADLTDLFSYPNLSSKEAEIVSNLLILTNQGSIHNLIAYISDILDAYQDQDQDDQDNDPWGYADTEDSIQDGWGENYDMV
jgi:hypothetical protein